ASDAPQVVSVTADGEARGVGLGRATIRAVFEALTATRPLRVVPDFEGVWTGEYRIAKCTRTSGRGPDFCRAILGIQLPFKLALIQTGDRPIGTLDLYDNLGGPLETGSVEGSIDDDGALLLAGDTRSLDEVHPRETKITDWRSELAADSDSMIGRFVQTTAFINAWGPQQSREECEIVRLERAPRS
ncbi:MAG TPA: hypothetical protein VNK92_03385, partial [Vicinamibacterales bacterium]|nr:hypothetical protein [Vicinamibacterales bacterium]